jgi:hypothetical protein
VTSLNLFLRPGTYGVLVGGGTLDGSPFTSLAFALRGLILSDPIGPQPVSTTTQPSGAPAPSPQPDPPPAQPSDPPPLTFYSPVLPVDPLAPAWWIAPPTDWTTVDWTSLTGLLLS